MSNVEEAGSELLTIPGNWNIQYNYAAGRVASSFFKSLKEEGKLFGTTCPNCRRTLVPPRSFCERCFVPTTESREVGPEGTVVTFTICMRRTPGLDCPPPFMLGMIRLDGADTNMVHLVTGVNLDDPLKLLERVRAGLRVKAHVRPASERKGHILDIASFEAIG